MKIVGFIGPSNVGKTTLLCRLIERLSAEGHRVGALKHDAHDFQMDTPGKDTYRLRHAGAAAIAIASKTQRAMICSTMHPTTLAELVASLPQDLDLVLVEGYKAEGAPKIEVHRNGLPFLYTSDKTSQVVAVVTDAAELPAPGPRRFGFDDFESIYTFVRGYCCAP